MVWPDITTSFVIYLCMSLNAKLAIVELLVSCRSMCVCWTAVIGDVVGRQISAAVHNWSLESTSQLRSDCYR